MLSVPVVNMKGDPAGEVTIDPAVLGGRVRAALIKQAIVAYLDHQRSDSARTKGRAAVAGSTRKLYRQKGTGNARAGMIRTPVRRGGGRAFAKRVPHSPKELSKKMRRLARDSAILAKIKASEVVVLDGFQCAAPKTKAFATMLTAIGADRGCVFATVEYDRAAYLSGRNVARTEVRSVDEMSVYDVLKRSRVVFTRAAFERLSTRTNGK